ncbi:MAG TPA: hypothetical protein VGP46_07925 [Acidimicrobiales bacterium]|nr:hypothetical protein [Acidimicrobiales bacterium]
MDQDPNSNPSLENDVERFGDLPPDASPAERLVALVRRTHMSEPRFNVLMVAVGCSFLAVSVFILGNAYGAAIEPGSFASSFRSAVELAVEWATSPAVGLAVLLATVLLWFEIDSRDDWTRGMGALAAWAVVLGVAVALAGLAACLADNIGSSGPVYVNGTVVSIALSLSDIVVGVASAAIGRRATWALKQKRTAIAPAE